MFGKNLLSLNLFSLLRSRPAHSGVSQRPVAPARLYPDRFRPVHHFRAPGVVGLALPVLHRQASARDFAAPGRPQVSDARRQPAAVVVNILVSGPFPAARGAGSSAVPAAAPAPVAAAPSPRSSPLGTPTPAAVVPPPAAATPAPAASSTPTSYLPSNMPAIWLAMHPTLRRSPTMLAALERLKEAGWTVQCNSGQGSQCNTDLKQIDLDLNGPIQQTLSTLAHEIGHTGDRSFDPRPYASAQDMLKATMDSEVKAFCSNLQVRHEILANGGIDIGCGGAMQPYYIAAWQFYQRHGDLERLKGHIGRMVLWEANSRDGATYYQAYLNNFQKFHGLPLVPPVDPGFVLSQRIAAWQALQQEMAGRRAMVSPAG